MTLATSRAMRRLTVRWLVLDGAYYYSDRAQLRRLRRAVQAEREQG
jgi:hypothetical protein